MFVPKVTLKAVPKVVKTLHLIFDSTFSLLLTLASVLCESAIMRLILQEVDSRLRLIWSRTHLVPGLLVPNFLSPWTNGPQKFSPPGQMVPKQFGPPGQMVPKNLVPLDKWSQINLVPIFPNHHSLSPWTNRIF